MKACKKCGATLPNGTCGYAFKFAGRRIHESAKTESKVVAQEAERQCRRRLEETFSTLEKRQLPPTFDRATDEWLTLKSVTLSPRSVQIEQANLIHLLPKFGRLLITDINGMNIGKYQQGRLKEGASPKTINLEIGTVRAIMRWKRLWGKIQPDVKMLKVSNNVGQALTHEEEARLLEECSKSRSRSLYPAVILALSTTMRYSEIRLLKWKQVDFFGRRIWVGKSKTQYGEGRPIKMNDRCMHVTTMWADTFPGRKPEHYVFPTEKYGAAGDDFKPCVHSTDPTVPIGDWKEAWEAARERAGLNCRFHDLRHTACTRMLEAGKPFPLVARIMGWSPSTAVRMSFRYGHFSAAAQEEAVEALNGPKARQNSDSRDGVHWKVLRFSDEKNHTLAN